MKLHIIIAIGIITQGVFAAGISIDPVTGIDMGSNKITNLSQPTLITDAANKKYVDDAVAAKPGDDLGDHTATLFLDMASNKIINLPTPEQPGDAATKGYIDGLLSSAPALPPKSGQTLCYDEWGTEIPCSSTGQDGDLERGVTWPHPRFIDNLDGTITDNLTGLIWLQNASCTSFFGGDTNFQNNRFWKDALEAANKLSAGNCGLTDGSFAGDWSLPNYLELYSLIAAAYFDPALSDAAGTGQWTTDGDAFSGVKSGWYWSSTSYADTTSGAWAVHFRLGINSGSSKFSSIYVWPVRAGQ